MTNRNRFGKVVLLTVGLGLLVAGLVAFRNVDFQPGRLEESRGRRVETVDNSWDVLDLLDGVARGFLALRALDKDEDVVAAIRESEAANAYEERMRATYRMLDDNQYVAALRSRR